MDFHVSDAMVSFFITGVILSIGFNLIVIIVVLMKCKRVRNIDLFQLSLALCDMIQASIGYPIELYAALNVDEIGKTACKVAGFSTTFLGLVSMNHLLGISIERCIMLNFPWKAREWLANRVVSLYIIVPSWLYGLVWAVLPLLGWSSYVPEHGTKFRCSINMTNENPGAVSYAYSLLTSSFIVPIVGITVSSIFTLRKLKKMRNQAKLLGASKESTSSRRSSEIKHSIMVFVLILTFLISWAPYASCVFMLTTKGTVNESLLTQSALFAKSSTIYNPIIYAIFMKDFRYRCLVLFRCTRVARLQRERMMTSVSGTDVSFHHRPFADDERESCV